MNASLTEVFRDLIMTQSLPMFDIGLDIDKDQNYILEVILAMVFKSHIRMSE